MLTLALALISTAMLNHFDSTRTISQSWIDRGKVFYVAEGVRSIATQLIENYMALTPQATSADIVTMLNASLPPLIPAPYAVSTVTAILQNPVDNMPIPNGPFTGMLASVTNIDLSFTVTGPSSSLGSVATGNINITLAVAQLSQFQFSNFFDLDYVSWWPLSLLNLARVHANGIFCMGGFSGLNLTYATTSANIFDAGNAGCWRTNTYGAGNQTTITNTSNVATSLLPNGDSLCANCLGTGTTWADFAKGRWGGHVLDSVQGMQALKFSGVSTEPMQFGIGFQQPANFRATLSNANRSRFLVDPLHAGDTAQARPAKFAYKADIRVLDGVWYLKDPANASAWPGIPIWSDHPGRFTDSYGINVGQEDIRTRWSGSPNQWTAGDMPHYFSFYEYDFGNLTIVDDSNGVISYGAIGFRSGVWMPGYWLDESGGLGDVNLCNFPTYWLQMPGPPVPASDCGGPDCHLYYLTHGSHCQGNYPNMSTATKVLAAARSGFRDGHIQDWAGSTTANMLPINFDVTTFATALGSAAAGELGSYFGAGNFMGRAFNGIVYVSGTWPGSANGYGSGLATPAPSQGAVVDVNQSGPFSVASQQALPFPLCSNSTTAPTPGLAGSAFDTVNQGPFTVNRFVVPDCASYNPAGITAYPNSVRLINGATISAATFPAGLTVATNLPVYVVGDFNTSSNTATSTSTPWIPVLVAGDQMGLGSNSWSDAWSPWNVSTSNNSASRVASNTTFNAALLNGFSEFTDAQFNPGLNENWTGRTLTLRGSLSVGFHPVYYQYPRRDVGNTTFMRPTQNFSFDPHFGQITRQPPGTTFYEVSAVLRWIQL